MSKRIAVPQAEAFVEKASDCYCTPPQQLGLVGLLWLEGIALDPFHDPSSLVEAWRTLDIRRGQDAWSHDWADEAEGGSIFANGPYSGDGPAKTARKCAEAHQRGCEVLNLTPAAIGAKYWRQLVAPWATRVAHLGRLPFVAGRDMFDGEGKLLARKGSIVHGNRTEIALVYSGRFGVAFERLWTQAGYLVSG